MKQRYKSLQEVVFDNHGYRRYGILSNGLRVRLQTALPWCPAGTLREGTRKTPEKEFIMPSTVNWYEVHAGTNSNLVWLALTQEEALAVYAHHVGHRPVKLLARLPHRPQSPVIIRTSVPRAAL